MRIAMVSEHASPLAALGGVDAGGQNVHVEALARGIARRGVEVVVHTRRDRRRLPRQVQMAPGVVVDHVDAGPPREIPKDDIWPHVGTFADELVARWSAERPDVVHAHFWMSGWASLLAARELGIPVVQTFHALGVVKRRHQGDRDTSPGERLGVEREICARVARIAATCTDEVFELVRIGADRRRIAVIPCGVDLRHFTPDGPAEPVPEGRRRLVCLGRLVERKGFADAVEALVDLPGAELVIAGGPERAALGDDAEAIRLRRLAAALGVGDRVDLRGRVERDALPALIRSADAVLCVPWYEPFGIVPLEAMACGVPVVATRVGGMIDTVVHEETGVHVPPRDPAALARALRDLLGDRARLDAYGRAGRRRVERRYGWDSIAGATLELYGELAAAERAGHRAGVTA